MKDIDKIIRQSDNPFESELTPGNFWYEQPDTALMVDSIHQEVVDGVEKIITQMNRNKISKTLIISGDSGSGKSYLLGRIKRTLNQKAFFAYINPWPDSKFIWRHILRQTVDSLVCKPEGQQDSQLLLWIKSLSAFRDKGFIKWVLGEKGLFISNLRATYPVGIYHAKEFFGVLYDLTNPELYPLACDWLRGDDLDEDDLQKLKVKQSIDSEQAAKNILGNFGKIAADTQPIVLCFDQLDNIPNLDNGFLDLQALFNFNSTVYNEYFKKFLIIISIITDTWKRNKQQIQPANLARLNHSVTLKQINLDQAEALWAMRLHSLYANAESLPESNIYPLKREQLENSFPGGKTLPRNALILGRNLLDEYQKKIVVAPPIPTPKPPVIPSFKAVWNREYQKIQKQITTSNQIAEPELIKMLREVLAAWQISAIRPRLLSGKYNINSFSYRSSEGQRIGVVWTENPNMTSFCAVMRACQQVITKSNCDKLYLIRSASVGHIRLRGNQVYRQIFKNSSHSHFQPTLNDIHYLATYHQLVNAAKGNELLVSANSVSLEELQSFIRESGIMSQCLLLQHLGIVPVPEITPSDLQQIRELLLTTIESQQLIKRQALIDTAIANSKRILNNQIIHHSLQELIQENQIQIMNSQAEDEEQIICLVPD
ncbi:MAG: P-loop NTPase fold protein [Xenococcaceae cyanobacterium MO_167.B27]|nr:P-loop NTPase fold protein [Xenococcaceae cyanobacterium MO_167.B27]